MDTYLTRIFDAFAGDDTVETVNAALTEADLVPLTRLYRGQIRPLKEVDTPYACVDLTMHALGAGETEDLGAAQGFEVPLTVLVALAAPTRTDLVDLAAEYLPVLQSLLEQAAAGALSEYGYVVGSEGLRASAYGVQNTSLRLYEILFTVTGDRAWGCVS